jgi:hypothetical protein
MRFNLRKLFYATLFFALACSLAMYLTTSYRERLAIRSELKAIGIDEVIFEPKDNNMVRSIFAYRPIENPLPERFKRLKVADLKGNTESAHSLEVLHDLDEVRFVILSASDVSDDEIAKLKDIRGLKHLWLTNTKVTDACIDSLAEIENLESIKLEQTAITAEGIERLRSLKPRLKVDY